MAIRVGAFFEQGGWASERVLEVCETLSDEQLDAPGAAAFGSIRETLVHMLSAEQYYLGRVGGVAPVDLVVHGKCPGFEVLKRAARANGVALAEAAESLPGDSMVAGTSGDEFVETSATVFFVQAINHSTEHRTQVLTMLSALGAGPEGFDAQIDGWSWGGASGELRSKAS